MLIRSLRSLAKGYQRQNDIFFNNYEEGNPNLILETEGVGKVQIENQEIKNVILNASITPIPLNLTPTLKLISKSQTLWEIRLNDQSKIDQQSVIQNIKSCCSAVKVNFENTGFLITEDEKKLFIGTSCDQYQLEIENNTLYIKNFLNVQKDIQEVISPEGIIRPNAIYASRILYPCGGFYEYGVHPKLIESCVFFAPDFTKPFIKITPLSGIKQLDPTKDTQLKSGKYFIGIKEFSKNQMQSLYDDIVHGECKITLRCNDKTKIFESNSLIYQEKTNLIQINFIQQKDNI